jgi:CRP/FNR family transcriptional regulator, cyclic AMP receptor protein
MLLSSGRLGGGRERMDVLRGRVRVLDLDPDLGEGLDGRRFEAARARCTAGRAVVTGRTLLKGEAARPAASEQFGYLVLRGTILQRLTLAGRATVDLLGPGDVVRPWGGVEDISELVNPTRWQPLSEVDLAALDRVFLIEAAPWPEISVALANRVGRRVRSLLLRLAVAQIPQLETRLRVVLWDLADRFGHVHRDGVLLALRLRQDVVAALVSASRSAVNRKLASLERHGDIESTSRGWLLRAGPPPELFAPDADVPFPGHSHPGV